MLAASPALTTTELGAFDMAVKQLPSVELLRKALDYNPESGLLVWKARDAALSGALGCSTVPKHIAQWNSAWAGKAVGTPDNEGYLVFKLGYVQFKVHRVAYAIGTGALPLGQIDHIDGDPSNNRIENLRCVSALASQQNKGIQSNNNSGVTGVFWVAKSQRWHARISNGGRQIHLGSFSDFNEAVRVRKNAEKQHGFHHNHAKRPALIVRAIPENTNG